MSEQQIAKLAGALVEHQRHFGAMPTEDRQWAIQNTEAAIGLFAVAVKNRDNGQTQKPRTLLKFVASVSIAAIEGFKVSENFEEGKLGPVRIYWLGDDFKKHFGRKTESALEAVELKVHTLTKASLDAPIIAELAGNAEITMGQFFALLSKQGKGESGPLLTNGYANIAYIRDDEGVLWAVDAHWHAGRGGWDVYADSVAYPGEWDRGRQVLSR